MKTVLVTGATGFIGSKLCRELVNNNYKVIGLTRRDIDGSAESGIGITYRKVDLLNTSYPEDLLDKVDYVVHLAGNAHETATLPYSDYYISNCEPTVKLAEMALKAGVGKFVFMSTIKVNGEFTEQAFDSHSAANPADHYSKSKYEAENRLRDICRGGAMSYVIIRPPLVFGEGVKANFLSLIRLANSRLPLPFAGIHNARSMIYVSNLTDLVLKVLSDPAAADKAYLVKDVTLSICQLLKSLSTRPIPNVFLFHVPIPLLTVFFRLLGMQGKFNKIASNLEVDDSATRTELGWQPPVSFEKSIENTLDWYRKRKTA